MCCCFFCCCNFAICVFFAKLNEALLPDLVKSEMVINLFRQFTHHVSSSHKIEKDKKDKIDKKEVAEGLHFSFA